VTVRRPHRHPAGIEVKNLAELTAEATAVRTRDYLNGLQDVEEAASSACQAWERCQDAERPACRNGEPYAARVPG
jgi:hypothetical protein